MSIKTNLLSAPPPSVGWRWLAFALMTAFLTITYQMGTLPLIQPDEGRNAEVAREMKERGAWLVPTYNDQVYLDKPAAYFKAVALSLAVFGDNEFGARLPSALFGLGTLALVFAFARKEFGARAAVLALLVVATTPLYFIHARTVIFDIALTFFVCGSILAGYRAEEMTGSSRRNWYLLSALAAGGGTLIKGPVGFGVPLFVLVAFNLVEKRPQALLRIFHPLNVVVFLAAVLPWFIGVSLQHPDFPHYGLVEETFNRFTTTAFRRTKPFYFYAWIIPATFFPWSLLLPEACVAAFRRWSSLSRPNRFCIVWCLVVVIFFSISKSKLPGYVLSVVIPFGMLIGQLLDHALQDATGFAARMLRRMSLGLAIVAAILITALLLVAPQTHLVTLNIANVDLAQFSFAVLPLAILGAVVGGFAGWGWYRRRAWASVAALALLPMLLVVLGGGIFSVIYERRSARSMTQVMPPLPPSTELVFYRCQPNGLPFYLRRTGTLITSDGGELSSNYVKYALRKNPEWPAGLVRVADFDAWLASRRAPVYLIAREADEAWLRQLAASRGAEVQVLSRRFFGALLPPPGGS